MTPDPSKYVTKIDCQTCRLHHHPEEDCLVMLLGAYHLVSQQLKDSERDKVELELANGDLKRMVAV